MKYILMFVCTALFFASCLNDGKNGSNKINLPTIGSGIGAENKKIYDDIMAVHDSVMPLMGDLNEKKIQLREFNDRITEKNLNLKDTVLNTIIFMSKLEDDMSDWMSNFKTDDKLSNSDSTRLYLAEQKRFISELNANVKKGLAVSSGIIKKKID